MISASQSARMMKLSNLFSLFLSRNLTRRDLSIDAFRGLAIALMIFVNHVPPTNNAYAIFNHAAWSGWTVADTIFPAFLFLVGVSITLVSGASGSGPCRVPYAKIFRRAALLAVISFLLVNFPYYEIATFTIHGTLFRIGICYLIASLLLYFSDVRLQLACTAALLVGQWLVLEFLSVPGATTDTFTPEVNPSSYLDRLVFGAFAQSLVLNGPVPQGIVPTAGAVASTMIGVLAGHWIRTTENINKRVTGLFAVGFLLLTGGMAWSFSIPINKQVWTPSYVVFMGGISLQVLAMFYWYIEIRGHRRLVDFLRVAGVNALFFYVLAQVLQRILVYGRVYDDGGAATRLRYYIYDNWFAPWAPDKLGAFLYTLCFLALCYGVVYWLYRRRLFFKL